MEQVKLSPEYIAGFFDGEGSFGIGLRIDDVETGYENRKGIDVSVGIGQDYKHVLDLIKETFSFGTVGPSGHGKYGNIQWSWVCWGRENCRKFLDYVEPYLIVKKEQAKLFRQVLDVLKDSQRGKPIPKENMLKVFDAVIKTVPLKNHKTMSPEEKIQKIQLLKEKYLKKENIDKRFEGGVIS